MAVMLTYSGSLLLSCVTRIFIVCESFSFLSPFKLGINSKRKEFAAREVTFCLRLDPLAGRVILSLQRLCCPGFNTLCNKAVPVMRSVHPIPGAALLSRASSGGINFLQGLIS